MSSADSDSEEFHSGNCKIPPEHLPKFRKLASVYGWINRMEWYQLLDVMKREKLKIHGEQEVVKKRLKNHYRMQTLLDAKLCESYKTLYPYLVVIDFEATCMENNPPDYKFEIIEFPAILVDAENGKVIDHFQTIVRPTINPKLTEFCIKLTGITQNQIDTADPFEVCLNKFTEWLEKHELLTKHKFSIVTDGPFDMARFLYGQCLISEIPYPKFAYKWINIRKVFRSFYFSKESKYSAKCNVSGMLKILKINFEGNPHSGLDDSYNIAKICLRLLEDGAFLDHNERIISLKNPTPFGKDDPLPVRPVHNLFCTGIHKDVPSADADQPLHSRVNNMQIN